MEDIQNRKTIAVAWIRTYASGEECFHCLYKISTEQGRYVVERVPADKLPVAWTWLRRECKWKAHGVYYADLPGIVWALNLDEVRKAVAQFVSDGLWRWSEILLAPVRFSYGADLCGYAHMRSTRSQLTLRTLRARFPRAPELAFVPLEVLLREFGVGMGASGMSNMPQFQTEGAHG